MNHEWKKSEKHIYLPPEKPGLIHVPSFRFFTIEGSGDPNDDTFAEYIGVLYSLAYAVKMSPKKGMAPEGYAGYTVYPLEGVWDLTPEGRKAPNGRFDKKDIVFKLMIRQPDFVEEGFAMEIIRWVKKNKPNQLIDQVKFEQIEEGDCIQMLHKGSYDDEPAGFSRMEAYAGQLNYRRKSKVHREIYLSDARKVAPEKLRTVLRFMVEKLV